jgi:hypothetical protein
MSTMVRETRFSFDDGMEVDNPSRGDLFDDDEDEDLFFTHRSAHAPPPKRKRRRRSSPGDRAPDRRQTAGDPVPARDDPFSPHATPPCDRNEPGDELPRGEVESPPEQGQAQDDP